MNIFSRFKKHYVHYFIGVIVPAIINGISVPLLKQFLGTEKYGQYALYFNIMLIANLLLCGWLWQAILRFTAKEADKEDFNRSILFIALLAPVIFFVPALLIVWYISGSLLLGSAFAATLVAANLQLPVQAVLQANFHSKVTVGGEAVRTVSWLLLILLAAWLGKAYLWLLFAALFVSYSCSTIFLYYKSGLSSIGLHQLFPEKWKTQMMRLLRFGLPLALWYVLFYFVTYIDKVYMLRSYGQLMQGNYNALFDFTAKGLVLLLSPVLVSAYPLLSEAYEKGEHDTVRKMLRRLIGYEILAMILSLVGFWLVGYQLLFWLLKIPADPLYIKMGLLIIAGTFGWQIAGLCQKPVELRLSSLHLLLAVFLSFLAECIFFWLFASSGPLIFPLGYLVSAIIYLALTLGLQLKALTGKG